MLRSKKTNEIPGMRLLLLAAVSMASCPSNVFAYGWATGSDGVDYCYVTGADGSVPSNASPVSFNYCHQYAAWATGSDGNVYCYPTGSNGQVASGGTPEDSSSCDVSYKVDDGSDGNQYCYPADSFGNVPDGVNAVDFSYCQGGAPTPAPAPAAPRGPSPNARLAAGVIGVGCSPSDWRGAESLGRRTTKKPSGSRRTSSLNFPEIFKTFPVFVPGERSVLMSDGLSLAH